jgi:small subunit ribosomal protein S13
MKSKKIVFLDKELNSTYKLINKIIHNTSIENNKTSTNERRKAGIKDLGSKPEFRGFRGRYSELKAKPKSIAPQYVVGFPLRHVRGVAKALQKVYGIGRFQSIEVCRSCGRRPCIRVGNLEVEHVQIIESWRRENLQTGSDRRRLEYESINRHVQLGTVRGINIRRSLPVRGQRTSTNGITARRLNGKRATKLRS